MTNEGLRVFISWSGELSKGVATALREWLPTLFDSVDPWMSDVDIASGTRGLDEIHGTLAGSSFGIIVVTRENQNSPWMNYESGAISRSISNSNTRVVPLLVDLSGPSQLTGPLAQYQARTLDSDGVLRVVKTIGEEIGVSSETTTQRFNAFWPQLWARVERVIEEAGLAQGGRTRQRTSTEMTEEILELVRDISRSLDSTQLAGTAIDDLQLRELSSYVNDIVYLGNEFAGSTNQSIGIRGGALVDVGLRIANLFHLKIDKTRISKRMRSFLVHTDAVDRQDGIDTIRI